VDVNGNGAYVWGVSTGGSIYFHAGYSGAWQQVHGHLKQIAVAPNGHVWGVTNSGHIYFRKGVHGSWRRMAGILSYVTVNGDQGEHVWGLGSSGQIYVRNGGLWKSIPGRVQSIDVNKDGVVYAVVRVGRIYRRTGVNSPWQLQQGVMKQVSVGSTVWGVNAAEKLYYRASP